MKRLATIPSIKVGNKNCSATVGIEYVGDSVYVLSTHSGDGVSKQPCVLHKYQYLLTDDKTNIEHNVLYTATGKTSIAVHANSLCYLFNGLFMIATRNGKGDGYNQILVVNKSGRVLNKFQYSSMIATISGPSYSFEFYITVNGGTAVKYRQFATDGSKVVQTASDTILNFPDENETGNDICMIENKIYATKFNKETWTNHIYVFEYTKQRTILTPKDVYTITCPKGYTKFEVEGVSYSPRGLLIVTNGVLEDGTQSDEVYLL